MYLINHISAETLATEGIILTGTSQQQSISGINIIRYAQRTIALTTSTLSQFQTLKINRCYHPVT